MICKTVSFLEPQALLVVFVLQQKMPLYKALLSHKNSQISTKINPFYTSPPPSFNTTHNHPKPSKPLFYKSFHRPHKIISTFYSHHSSFPHFVAQKRPHLTVWPVPFLLSQKERQWIFFIKLKNLCDMTCKSFL